MARLVVVGGGVSGLAAAWAARSVREGNGAPFEIVVLERGAEVGGKIRTVRRDGFLVECGPTSYMDDSLALNRLIDDVGLSGRKLASSAASAHRFLVRDGKLRELGESPPKFFTSGILSPAGMLRLFAEPFLPRGGEDAETLWEWASRRLGREAADRLIAPLALGIVAGDAKRLSAAGVLPTLHQLEREHGSLVRGMFAKMKARKRAREAGEPVTSGQRGSFDSGMQTLPRALAATPGIDIRCDVDVRSIHRDASGSLVIDAGGHALEADVVVVATETDIAATLLRRLAPEAAARLAEIDVPPIAVIALGFDEAALPDLPVGFGTLVPRPEGLRHLGCLWDSHIFPGRAPDGKVLVRLMFGGAVDRGAPDLSDEQLTTLALEEMRRYLTVRGAPLFREVTRFPRAIPQYDPGHVARRREIEQRIARVDDVFLAGTSLAGVGVPRAVEAGLAAGETAGRVLVRHEVRDPLPA
jgi:oxygen-dependent protoporphyrinogen oxidase